MPILDYIQTTGGIIWTAACVPLGIFFAWLAVFIINKIPASWLCEYGESPSDELLSQRRVSLKKEGGIMSVVLCISFVLCRLQFNYGFDIYFIVLSLIILIAVMTAVCDLKYMIIPDQFTIALAVLSAALSIYDIIRGFRILHQYWWSPLVGIAIGGCTMLIIDFIGMKLYKKDGMGFGDVKLFAAVGILTGIIGTVCTFAMSLVTATIVFTVIIAVSKLRAGKKNTEQAENTENNDSDNSSEDIGNAENTDSNDESDDNEDAEATVSAKSYMAFGPYISAALTIYIVLFDIVNYLANLYIDLF